LLTIVGGTKVAIKSFPGGTMRSLAIVLLLAGFPFSSFGQQIQTCQKLKQRILWTADTLTTTSLRNLLKSDSIDYKTDLQISLTAYRDVCGPITPEMAEELLKIQLRE
jgi:hypothetical protein